MLLLILAKDRKLNIVNKSARFGRARDCRAPTEALQTSSVQTKERAASYLVKAPFRHISVALSLVSGIQ